MSERASQHRTREDPAAEHLLRHCGNLSAGEALLIVHDAATRDVALRLDEAARRISTHVRCVEIPGLARHGAEPPADVAEAMQQAQLVMGLTSMSMAHTRARLRAAEQGARYLSMPDYSLALLDHPAIRTDYRSHGRLSREIAQAFSAGSEVRVTTALGTDVRLDVRGRTGNACPGYVESPGDLGSPPDIEANVSPVETASEGTVVVDGSIPYPGFGILRAPVTLHVESGEIVRFEGEPDLVQRLEALFDGVGTRKARLLAECGVGLNPEAELDGTMLMDEGAAGTMHFGFGSNATVGGVNDVPFHLDFVFRQPTLEVDGQTLLEQGTIRR